MNDAVGYVVNNEGSRLKKLLRFIYREKGFSR